MVVIDKDRVIGFAQMQSDGELQAHLSLIAVDNDYRGRGIARQLIGVALLQAGGQRIDRDRMERDHENNSRPGILFEALAVNGSKCLQ